MLCDPEEIFYNPDHPDWSLIDANLEIVTFGKDDLTLAKEAIKIPKFLALGMASVTDISQEKVRSE
jgi:hypothetical protein